MQVSERLNHQYINFKHWHSFSVLQDHCCIFLRCSGLISEIATLQEDALNRVKQCNLISLY